MENGAWGQTPGYCAVKLGIFVLIMSSCLHIHAEGEGKTENVVIDMMYYQCRDDRLSFVLNNLN